MTPSKSSKWEWGEYFCLILGFSCCLEIQVGGRFSGTELLLLLGLPFLVQKRLRPFNARFLRNFVLFGLFWLVGQIITDLIRHTETEDLLKGWAKICFTIINFLALYLLLAKRPIRLVLYAITLALGQLVKGLLFPTSDMPDKIDVDPWKWVFSFPVTLTIIVAATLALERRYKKTSCALLAFGFLINLFFNYRSEAIICLLTLVFVAYVAFIPNPGTRKRLLPQFAIGFVVAIVFFNLTYSYAASHGLLGPNALAKYNNQTSGDLGIVLGGRAEGLVSLKAIADSPLIGHGSNARDPYYVDLLTTLYYEHGYAIVSDSRDKDLIPSHSHIFGAWIEAGVLGGVFWIWVLTLMYRGSKAVLFGKTTFTVLVAFCLATLAWDIPFSPYANDRRYITTFYILVVALAFQEFDLYMKAKVKFEKLRVFMQVQSRSVSVAQQ